MGEIGSLIGKFSAEKVEIFPKRNYHLELCII